MPTGIEWTDETWNPVRARRRLESGTILTGHHCEHVSEGCRNCYAESWNRDRLGTRLPFKPGHRKAVEIFLDEKVLLRPLHWRRPRQIFAGSMTDLFAVWVPDAWLVRMFAVAALASWHHFQFVTKRSGRLKRFTNNPASLGRVWAEARRLAAATKGLEALADSLLETWPLRNVIGIVSVEDQPNANVRVADLIEADLYRRGLSCEPLLGPVYLTRIRAPGCTWLDALSGMIHAGPAVYQGDRKLDWVICGGESGKEARPMHPDWARSLRDQCAQEGVAFFFKQWGEWGPDTGPDGALDREGFPRDRVMEGAGPCAAWTAGGWRFAADGYAQPLTDTDGEWLYRLGKKRNGRLLDGVTHDAQPESPA